MKVISIVFAIAGMGCGLASAYYWIQSSKIDVHPSWKTEPGDTTLAQMGWTAGILENISKGAEMNKKAALWTAASTLLNTLSAIAGSLA